MSFAYPHRMLFSLSARDLFAYPFGAASPLPKFIYCENPTLTASIPNQSNPMQSAQYTFQSVNRNTVYLLAIALFIISIRIRTTTQCTLFPIKVALCVISMP
eukprot:262660_1